MDAEIEENGDFVKEGFILQEKDRDSDVYLEFDLNRCNYTYLTQKDIKLLIEFLTAQLEENKN